MTRSFWAKAFTVASISGLAMQAVLAQAPEQQSPPGQSPPGQQQTAPGQPGPQQPSQEQQAPGSGASPTVSSSQVIGAQGADEWLASQLRGTAVVGADGRRIGEVVDVLLDRNGQARAFLVGTGGVMGLGAKEVAIDLSQFHDMPGPGNGTTRPPALKVPMTAEQLAAVPEFRPLPVPDATTGAAPR